MCVIWPKAFEDPAEAPGRPRGSGIHLGTGRGYSVLEMIQGFERACHRPIPFETVARRPGDIGACWADPGKAEKELAWKAIRTLDDMCADTWRWQQANPHGYDPS